eukprot:33067-Pelagomonas_calceolata.AAC.8
MDKVAGEERPCPVSAPSISTLAAVWVREDLRGSGCPCIVCFGWFSNRNGIWIMMLTPVDGYNEGGDPQPGRLANQLEQKQLENSLDAATKVVSHRNPGSKGDLKPDCLADRPVTGPRQPT